MEEGGKKKFREKQIRVKRANIFHFYAKIVKFGRILTHLKLFSGKLGTRKYLGHFPCGAATEL